MPGRIGPRGRIIGAVLLLFGMAPVLAADELQLKADHPGRYVVRQGDTLWSLADRFLQNPWEWPRIWSNNPQVENPHLIYPGDLLLVTSAGDLRVLPGKKAVPAEQTETVQAGQTETVRVGQTETVQAGQTKTVRLQPKVYREKREQPIPAISPSVIQAFLTDSRIIQPGQLERSGYVVSGLDDEVILGRYSQFYARNLAEPNVSRYRLFQVGSRLQHPETQELLGVEAIHLGDARLLRADKEVAKLQMLNVTQEIRPGDRLVPAGEEPALPYYQPHAPATPVSGWILHAPKGLREVGTFDLVVLSAGAREGLEEGHVVKAVYHPGWQTDPVDGTRYRLPDEKAGLMMVFKVFEKLSYALIMEAERAISVGDRFASP